MKRVSASALEEVMRRSLLDRGVCAESTEHVVASLIQTSLRGVDSHGLQLFPHYCRAVDAGRVRKAPVFSLDARAPGAAILDADHGFGHHAGAVAMDHAVSRAHENGIAVVVVRNSTHFGAASYFGLRAAARGCLGFAFTNADALMKSHGGREAMLGTNPVCFTAPMAGEEPLCLDMATSFVTWNKLMLYRRLGRPIPETWACDAEGAPVRDAAAARSLLPAGEHKGFGLGLMVEVLCSLLAGGPVGKDLPPMYEGLSEWRPISHCFMALAAGRFGAPGELETRLGDLAARIRRSAPLDPASPVMVAGDPEKAAETERRERGIPIDDPTFEELRDVSPGVAHALIP